MKNFILVTTMILMSAFTHPLIETRTISGNVYSNTNGQPLEDVLVSLKNTAVHTKTDRAGYYLIAIPPNAKILQFSRTGYINKEVHIGLSDKIDVYLVIDKGPEPKQDVTIKAKEYSKEAEMISVPVRENRMAGPQQGINMSYDNYKTSFNTEDYSPINENIFHNPGRNPLSTFSIDVDAASYSNVRRFITGSQMPPGDAVRIEEMINYFTYDYPQPEGEAPFAIFTEAGKCPWNEGHYLVHIGLQGKIIPTTDLPPSNLVFLIDVSGSMNTANKLPLLKSAFKLLVNELRAKDKISIVVYAGAAGVVLPSTSGDRKDQIIGALDNLKAGGSTAGGQGIRLAYKIAGENFMIKGNNRVILATDGDFNVGESSNGAMEELIEKERESGVFLTVLGFGMGNYKDSKMEILADKGNGNYAYIDNILEAKKVFVNEFGGTLFTIAKDVKIQVEFNPAIVQAYRLIGYENRKLRDEDFNDDKKDAGELGSGHTVTALYEIIPAGVEDSYTGTIDPLKYQKQESRNTGQFRDEMMTVKLRYKLPDENNSQLITRIIKNHANDFEKTSDNFRFSASVASFGMLLRDSAFKGSSSYDQVLEWARNSSGKDQEGYRAEFVRLVETTKLLSGS